MLEIPIIKNLSDTDKINWIRLSRTKNISRSTLLNLVNIFGNIEGAIENVAAYSIKGGLKAPINICPTIEAIKELENTRQIGAEIICFNEESYPAMLRQISDPPALLTMCGKIDLANQNIISVVGPRNASLNGCKFAGKIVTELGQAGLIIASGLARGIDAAVHKAALDFGTIGIIAGGIDNIYPAENSTLYQGVIEKGLLISETPFGMPPKGGNFPQRNRIISGIALGLVVIEATLRSGTLITARFALEQNREIFAVPGSPFDPRYEGTNRLIKQGAKLIENSADVLEDLEEIIRRRKRFRISENFEEEFSYPKFKAPDDIVVDAARTLILQKLNYTEVSVELLISELEIPAKIVAIALVQLELADRIEHRNGKVCLKK